VASTHYVEFENAVKCFLPLKKRRHNQPIQKFVIKTYIVAILSHAKLGPDRRRRLGTGAPKFKFGQHRGFLPWATKSLYTDEGQIWHDRIHHSLMRNFAI